jgi:hypothetical protein
LEADGPEGCRGWAWLATTPTTEFNLRQLDRRRPTGRRSRFGGPRTLRAVGRSTFADLDEGTQVVELAIRPRRQPAVGQDRQAQAIQGVPIEPADAIAPPLDFHIAAQVRKLIVAHHQPIPVGGLVGAGVDLVDVDRQPIGERGREPIEEGN